MVSEWFHDRLDQQGHRRLSQYVISRSTLSLDTVLAKLAEQHFVHVLDFKLEDAYSHSSEFMLRLINEGADFDPWISFQSARHIHFAFVNHRDAVQVKLMWPS